MALKIKKYITDSDGRIVEEVEGTQAEVEAYEKKRAKQGITEVPVKKKQILKG